jgi:hypothetical protein
LIFPEVDALDNVYCQYGLTCGDVTVGLSNQDYEGSCWPSFSHSLGGASYSTSHEGEEPCGGWPSCSGDFYCSITKDLLNATGPTYLTMVVENWGPCTCGPCTGDSGPSGATFYVKGIKPEWIDVGIETQGGGMSEDSCGNWIDTSGSCTCTTSCDSSAAYVPVVEADTDQDGCWDDEFVLGPSGPQGSQGIPCTNSPVNAGFLVISSQGVPAQGSITIQYTASVPGTAPPEGTSLRIMTASGDYVAPGSYNLNGSGCITVNGESADLSLLRAVEFQNGGITTPQNIQVTLNGTNGVASDTALVDPWANMKVCFLHTTGTIWATIGGGGLFSFGHTALGFLSRGASKPATDGRFITSQ